MEMPEKKASKIVAVLGKDLGYECTHRRMIVVRADGQISRVDELR
jgi:hypothetical protein